MLSNQNPDLEQHRDQLEPHMIRASVDLRVPNKYMERNRITQGPVVEDFMYKFNECKVFFKLDVKQGYHQLLLDPSLGARRFSFPFHAHRGQFTDSARTDSPDL